MHKLEMNIVQKQPSWIHKLADEFKAKIQELVQSELIDLIWNNFTAQLHNISYSYLQPMLLGLLKNVTGG